MCCCRSCKSSTTSSTTRNTGPARSSRKWWLRATSDAKPAEAFIAIDPAQHGRTAAALAIGSPQLTEIYPTSLDCGGMRCNVTDRFTTSYPLNIQWRGTMSKLRFDPITYQFYIRSAAEDGAPARAAGFGWDPVRRRYYTEDPKVAVGLASSGDNYVKHLLADAL